MIESDEGCEEKWHIFIARCDST